MFNLDEAVLRIRDRAWAESVRLDWSTMLLEKTKVVSDFSFSGEEYTAAEFTISVSGVQK
jgi:hypothetical protein